MALQTHSAALHPLKTLKLAAGALVSATLRATIKAALVAAPYNLTAAAAELLLVRVKHADLLINAGTVYMSDCGDPADVNAMPYGIGEKREIRNCKELLNTVTVFSAAAYDVRVEIYS